MTQLNREYKDSLFTIVFGEGHKENALSLYNAINGTSYDDPEQIIITTLEDVIYVSVKNDTSFILDHTMNLYEHQSTVNPNMPLRGLFYFTQLYKDVIATRYGDSAIIYSNRLLEIPSPRYYVFYNGTADQRERYDMHLSDAYSKSSKGDIEVTAHILNINRGYNQELMDMCKPLRDISELVQRIRDNKSQGVEDEEAVSKAIDSCIDDNILKELLERERVKVSISMLRALTDEEIKKVNQINLEYAIEQGLEQGLEQGIVQGREEPIINAYNNGHSAEEISDFVGIPLDDVREIIEKLEL